MGEEKESQEYVDTYGGRVQIEWEENAAVTPMGQVSYFIDFLKTAGLYDAWIQECPLEYQSPNGPRKEDVLGTIFLGILSGHKRYAHITGIRGDGVNPGLLGMRKVVSEDSVRRAFEGGSRKDYEAWGQSHLRRSYEPLLYVPWILDIDTTVKPLYGHQEGAVIGYNPRKPGRPSHVYHTYFIGNLRIVLDVEIQPGDCATSLHSRPGLFAFLDHLPKGAWPQLLRGDCSYGNEGTMVEAEQRGVDYLFKLRQSPGVRKYIQRCFQQNVWVSAGAGWEAVEGTLQLQGWTRSRRVIVLRRELPGELVFQSEQSEFVFVETLSPAKTYEFAVLVTSSTREALTLSQLYRDRADAENVYDELKNQWAWCGFTTQDLQRSQIMARIVALIYNWWNCFSRLAIPDKHIEAITGRPLLLQAIGRQTQHGRQTTLTLTSLHAKAPQIQQMLSRVSRFLSQIKQSAEQLDWYQKWHRILSRVFTFFLKGKPLPFPQEALTFDP
jgi:Transposase DDE domain group 1